MKTVHFEFDTTDEEAEDLAEIFRKEYLHADDSSRNEEVDPAARVWWAGRAKYLHDFLNYILASSSRIPVKS